MYEHPVFCLASQVMDLTIREYLPPPHHAVFTLSVFIISRKSRSKSTHSPCFKFFSIGLSVDSVCETQCEKYSHFLSA